MPAWRSSPPMRRGLVPGQQLGREAPTGQALGYFYFEEEPGRRSSDVRYKATAVIGCFSSKTARSRLTRGRHNFGMLSLDMDTTVWRHQPRESDMSRSTIALILSLLLCPVLSLAAQAQSGNQREGGAIHCRGCLHLLLPARDHGRDPQAAYECRARQRDRRAYECVVQRSGVSYRRHETGRAAQFRHALLLCVHSTSRRSRWSCLSLTRAALLPAAYA